jgi:hypothetical protein
LVEHDRDDAADGGAAQDDAVAAGLGDHGLVGVGLSTLASGTNRWRGMIRFASATGSDSPGRSAVMRSTMRVRGASGGLAGLAVWVPLMGSRSSSAVGKQMRIQMGPSFSSRQASTRRGLFVVMVLNQADSAVPSSSPSVGQDLTRRAGR